MYSTRLHPSRPLCKDIESRSMSPSEVKMHRLLRGSVKFWQSVQQFIGATRHSSRATYSSNHWSAKRQMLQQPSLPSTALYPRSASKVYAGIAHGHAAWFCWKCQMLSSTCNDVWRIRHHFCHQTAFIFVRWHALYIGFTPAFRTNHEYWKCKI